MNKYCVIARNFRTYFIKRLSEEVGKELALYNPWGSERIPNSSVYFFRSSAVYGSEKDLEAIRALPPEAIVLNSPTVINNFRDKNRQYSLSLGRPFSSIPWTNLQGKSLPFAMEFIRENEDIIVKPIRGQGGWGVEKHNLLSFPEWWKQKLDDEFLLQKYLDGEEMRLFFIRDEYYLLRRKAESVAVNFSQGGEAELIPITEELRSLARECIKNSGAFYGAIDLIFYQGKYHFLELNNSPGIEQLEQITGLNIVQKLLISINPGI